MGLREVGVVQYSSCLLTIEVIRVVCCDHDLIQRYY